MEKTKEEIKKPELEEEELELEDEEPASIKLKCKPCYNFQTIEFEWEVSTEQDVYDMFDFYSSIYQGLMKICPDEAKKVEEPATDKQIEVMNRFHISYPKDVTKKQAQELIKKNLNK